MKNTETYAKAVDRIRDEMAKEANHPGIQFLGGWLTGELEKRPELAEKLLEEKKSVKGAFEEIRSYASKHKTGNFAFVPPEQATQIVAGYYGFDIQAQQNEEPQALAPAVEPEPKPEKAAAFDLDELLGGL